MSSTDTFFKDLIVIEAANVLAGPAVGMFFAELGATVIKVENIKTGGDTTRQWKLPAEDRNSDVSAYFSSVNWGKRSIGVDFAIPAGYEVIVDLVRRADVFLQSFKPGDARKFGLDYPVLRDVNDRLIYADITAFGETDERPGFDAVLQAETGFMGMNGTETSGPVKMPVALIDLLLAHQLKEALLIALIERMQSGRGSYNTVSLFQSGVASLANQAANYLVAGTVPGRAGSDHPNIAPYGTVFRTLNGEPVVLAVGTDSQFQALCEVLDIPEAAADGRFATNQQRVVHRDALNALLTQRIGGQERDDLLDELQARQVPAGAVRRLDDVLAHASVEPLLLQGKRSDGVPIHGLRTVAFESDVVTPPPTLDSPPAFDADSRYVLAGVLGYTEERIQVLRDAGAVL
ncbi:MAG: CaiB/BaiF CoA-transferase family protein [Gemmatimonadetes bacterium]|nr:CaiB/BaiF CoA-transferase family protein [Gemmatimonadota bacterium]